MKFAKIINKIIPAKNENPLSRLFGYQRDASGKMQIVHPEAKIIMKVIEALATRSSDNTDAIIDDLLIQFKLEGIRNRSGKNWTRQTLISLVRPVYGGVAVSRLGIWRTSKIYPPIVSPELVKTALRRLKTVKPEIGSPKKSSQSRMAGV